MHPSTLSLMYEHVRAIYHALTGSDLPEPDEAQAQDVTPEETARRFAELEAMARTIPTVAERVAPFSFMPPIDIYEEGRDLLIEVAVSGVERGDVTVERTRGAIVVSGVRRGERASNGRACLHAEIPRGPFHRVVPLPHRTSGEPRVEVKAGVVTIQLTKSKPASA
jgi:HSP20 family molecular chaperone IbpA